MRHRVRGRHLGRTPSHRKAMFQNMAVSLIRTVRPDLEEENAPAVPGRIVTTVPKAKEIRPFVEKLVTLARKSLPIQRKADGLNTSAEKNSPEWKTWRESEEWNEWNQAVAPAVAMRRKAFALLRDKEAVDILFSDLAEAFEDRPGGYTRIVKLATRRLGDGGQQAILEFVFNSDHDRVKTKRVAPVVTDSEESTEEALAEEVAEEQPATQETTEEVAAETAEASDAESESDEEKEEKAE